MAVRSRVIPTTLLAGVALTAVAACGGSKGLSGTSGAAGSGASGGAAAGNAGSTANLAPQPALNAGLTNLTNQQSLDIVASLGITPADLVAVSAGDNTDGSKPLTLAQAQLITASSIEIISHSTNGSTIAQAKQAVDTSFAVQTAGDALFEVRAIGGTDLYLRADVPKILAAEGKPSTALDSQLASLPPQYAFAKDAAAGKWLKVDLASLKMLESQYAGMLGGASANPSQAAAGQQALLSVLSKDVTATAGPDSPKGQHLILTANAKTLATDYTTALGTLVPGGSQALGSKTTDVPDQTVTLDAYLKDGALSEVDVDLAQLASPADKARLGGKAIPLTLLFKSGGATVSAPADATSVDVASLVSGLVGSLGATGGADASGSASFLPTDLPTDLPTSFPTP